MWIPAPIVRSSRFAPSASLLAIAMVSLLTLRAATPRGRATPSVPPPAEAPAAELTPATETEPKSSPPANTREGRGSAVAAAKISANAIEVTGVRFASATHGNNSANSWNETEIEINVKPAATKGDSRFANRVRITLTIAADGPENALVYYRATAEAVALQEGRSKVRFYLPPEIVRRDTLRTEPKLWAVDIVAAGQPMTSSRLAANMSTPAARADFLKKAAASAPANDGILVPQYLTPFAFDIDRPSPAFVRAEAVR
jgi:hypothetical protein